MAWYRCLICGENFPGSLIGVEGWVGFYTVRFVEARCAELAERLVLQQLRSELVPPLGYTPSKQERVYIEQLEIVEAGQVPARQQGFVWYLMESALTNSNGTSDPAVDEPTH